ncbi:MAG: class I SAM-dependent methyltransferase [Anaerolineae bacterium]|nr:class I SAM-dependent methyltransferase [Anaerolineae bacterium]
MAESIDNVDSSYDQVAGDYAAKYLNEFDYKPLDRELLTRFAHAVAGRGRVCDLGCGPGQVARFLKSHRVDVFGVDVSAGMVQQARAANPTIKFQQGDMRHLDLPDASLAGIAAFYAIIHIPQAEVPTVLRELHRVLQPAGLLLLTFHKGDEIRHIEEFFGKHVSLDFRFFQRPFMEEQLRASGFLIEDVIEREPYLDVEAQTNRVYIFARKTD